MRVMKKIFMLFALVFLLFTLHASTSEGPIDKRVLKDFQTKFEGATDVSWTVGNTYFEAVFTLHGQKLYAFYGLDSEFIAVARYVSSSALPLRLQTNLKKMMGVYWITDLFEATNEQGTMYYVTLEKADSKMVLESAPTGNWEAIQKDKE